jgi:hypothetical protein
LHTPHNVLHVITVNLGETAHINSQALQKQSSTEYKFDEEEEHIHRQNFRSIYRRIVSDLLGGLLILGCDLWIKSSMFPAGSCKSLFGRGEIILRTACVRRMYSNSFKCGVTCKGQYWHCSNLQLYQIGRSYAFKSDLKIKWVRPPKIPSIKPEKSGDLSPLPTVDKNQYPIEFQKSEELKT